MKSKSDEFDVIFAMVNRAKREIELHKLEIKEHPCWYSGHKSKAQRAISVARELLLEASKSLEATT